MQEAMDLMAMNALVRRAVVLVSGMDIGVHGDRVHMDVRCSLPWFKVRRRCDEQAGRHCSPDRCSAADRGKLRAGWLREPAQEA